ncbi:MAG TPA: hypothetical protein VF796_10275 [Humisphaera sp.]
MLRRAIRAARAVKRRLGERMARPPTADEAAAIGKLRETIGSLDPIPPAAAAASPAAAEWDRNRQALRDQILTQDPRRFLSWEVIRQTMFVDDAPYVRAELSALRAEPDWAARWEPAVREDAVGAPPPCPAYRRSSGNLIHHAYHLSQFERATGWRIGSVGSVLEFGGGYGSLCRLAQNLGFAGRYTILDVPEFSALQRYFLSSRPAAAGGARVECVTDVDRLGAAAAAGPAPVLFVATWSVSETPLSVRGPVLDRVAGADAFLIGYQHRFGEVDNVAFFEAWRRARADVRWTDWPIEHLPGNRYLMGVRTGGQGPAPAAPAGPQGAAPRGAA